jgi:hypothetical protein
MKNIPKIIYLQIGENGEIPEDFKDCCEVTWCVDKINDTDIEYSLIEKSKQHENISSK